MKLLSQGAEAKLFLGEYLDISVLVKERVVKGYRDRKLDARIRKARTSQECLLLHRAKEQGVRTPVIYKIDKNGSRILMEFIEGRRLKDYLNAGNVKICKAVGEAIGRMHAAQIIHGDLTTSNIIVKGKERGLVFVDFGLGFMSSKLEDRAVDLLVFKKTYMATHFSLGKGWDYILKGYLKEYPKGKQVLKHLGKVEARVRYH